MRPRPQEPLLLRQPESADGVLLREQVLSLVLETVTNVKQKATSPLSSGASRDATRFCPYYIDSSLFL
jgi:hypothetical protein